MLDKDLTREFEVMEKLQEDGKIDYYIYNSRTGDFRIFTDFGDKTITVWFDEETIIDIIIEMEKELEEAEKENQREMEHQEKIYWEKQLKI